MIKYRGQDGSNDRSLFSPRSGDQKSKTKVSAGLVSPETWLFKALSPNSHD